MCFVSDVNLGIVFLILDADVVLEEEDPVDSKDVVVLIKSLDHGFFFDGVDECIFRFNFELTKQGL